MDIRIKKFYTENTEVGSLEVEFDQSDSRPAWIHVKNKDFKARFIVIQTSNEADILYKRFTGNFYYPVDVVLQPSEEKRFYDKYAQYYDENTAKNNLPMAQFLLDKLNGFIVSKDAKILDAGAGTGIFSNLAAENSFSNLTLVDIYDSMLNVAKKKPALNNMNFIVGDIEKVNLPDNYDALVSVMMFDALDDTKLEKALKNIASHLTKDAHVFLIEDKKRNLYSEFFTEIESGLFDVSKGKDFQKYFFVGKVKN